MLPVLSVRHETRWVDPQGGPETEAWKRGGKALIADFAHSSSPPFWECLTKAPTGEKFALFLFLATCINAAFLWPPVTLVVGERSKVFTGALCALSLLAAVLLVKRTSRSGSGMELAASVALLTLATISGMLSSTPESSLYRGFVVMASGLGGFLVRKATAPKSGPPGSVQMVLFDATGRASLS